MKHKTIFFCCLILTSLAMQASDSPYRDWPGFDENSCIEFKNQNPSSQAVNSQPSSSLSSLGLSSDIDSDTDSTCSETMIYNPGGKTKPSSYLDFFNKLADKVEEPPAEKKKKKKKKKGPDIEEIMRRFARFYNWKEAFFLPNQRNHDSMKENSDSNNENPADMHYRSPKNKLRQKTKRYRDKEEKRKFKRTDRSKRKDVFR